MAHKVMGSAGGAAPSTSGELLRTVVVVTYKAAGRRAVNGSGVLLRQVGAVVLKPRVGSTCSQFARSHPSLLPDFHTITSLQPP